MTSNIVHLEGMWTPDRCCLYPGGAGNNKKSGVKTCHCSECTPEPRGDRSKMKKIIRTAAIVFGVVAMALAAGADITWPWV